MQRSRSIDLYRGLGVTTVIWSHSGLPWMPGAYVTIDGFFLISGYLVTQSFLSRYESVAAGGSDGSAPTPWQAYRATALLFLEGRVRRILLPLFVAIATTFIAGWFLLLPADLNDLAQAGLMSVLLSGNLHAAAEGGYFEITNQAAPLLHTWSLALEEQFYLCSLGIVALYVLQPRRRLFAVIILGLCLASLLTAQYYSTHPDLKGQSYFLFITRIWQFLMGVALCQFVREGHLKGRLARVLQSDGAFALGWALILASVALLTPLSPSPGLISVPALLGVCLIIIGQPTWGVFHKLLQTKPLLYVGKNVYGIYLFHFPIIVFTIYAAPPVGPWLAPMCFALSYAYALVLGAATELPFNRWRSLHFRTILLANAVLLMAILGFVFIVKTSGGAPERMPRAAQEAYLAKFLVNPERERCLDGALTTSGYSCTYGPSDARKVLLIGDSHSDALANALARRVASQGLAVDHYWFAECPAISSQLFRLDAFTTECERLSFEAHQTLFAQSGVDTVVYALLWPWYLGTDHEKVPFLLADKKVRWSEPGSVGAYQSEFMGMVEESIKTALSRNIRVVIQAPVPIFSVSPPEEAALNAWYRPSGWQKPLNTMVTVNDYERQRSLFDHMMAEIGPAPGLTVLDPKRVLCDAQFCKAVHEGRPIYYDGNHLNEAGAALVLSPSAQNQ